MFAKEFDEISLSDLQALVDEGIPEGRQLEFKRDHYGRKDEDRREFAADVSAMANAFGGYLLIGIDEKNGIASDVCGVTAPDPDGLVRAVSESIRASFEPPILEFRVKWIAIEGERGVLMIKAARSWSAPHRVTVAKDHRFFIRDENGKHPMSVEELRRAFLFASEIEERIRRFRAERLEILTNNEGPLAVGTDGDARLIMQVVPRASFTDRISLSFDERGGTKWPWPLGASGANPMYSLDGLVAYSGPEERFDSVRAFSTLFRNGIAEAVATVRIGGKDDQRNISLTGVEQGMASGVRQILGEYQRRSIPAPYTVLASLIGVRGVSAPIDEWRGSIAYPHRSDRIMLPELTIDATSAVQAPEIVLKPLFDLMWNAFGQYGSPNYDQSGKYVRR
ncbi:ATP-binding protein [Agrobacterium tumefaciens]|uniref:AlbA family DNA-binding domain-containing protein n=1 Tax=Agrobacterium tumefaciens TaxID=358 RepID=UPI001573351C|nr:ATP-binding protein [Agrobacterium tumefaciens]UXT20433.1 ATP-binding protein [Agrobacterium tumefaciens]WHO20775.1 ATP-binding protein [Agrobacterium tumefaciens]WHO23560.1 ATP-binding protein [Agrobacterium tumefaciens]